MKRYREIIGGSVFFLCATVYFVMAFGIKQFNDGIISSDFIPKLYGGILMVLSVLQVLFGVMNFKRQELEAEEENLIQMLTPVVLTFTLLIGYVSMLRSIGFVIMSSLFVFLMTCLLCPKDWRVPKRLLLIAVIGIGFSAAIYLIFTRGFALTLPAGILG